MIREAIYLLIREFFDQKISCIGLLTVKEVQQDLEQEASTSNQLLDDIKKLGFDPFPTYYYGENGFMVPGITKIQLIELGRKYNQSCVFWASKILEDKNGLSFEWNYLEDGKIRDQKMSNHPFVVPMF